MNLNKVRTEKDELKKGDSVYEISALIVKGILMKNFIQTLHLATNKLSEIFTTTTTAVLLVQSHTSALG